MILLARLVRLAAGVATLVLLAGIAVVIFEVDADPVLDAARWLADPFDRVFSPENRKLHAVLDLGLAAVIYSVAAAIVTSLLERGTRVGPLGDRFR